MNRNLIALNLILVGALLWGGFEIRRMWLEARQREAEVLARAVPPAPVAVPPAPPPVAPAPATDYVDVAQQTLFSADRNPNIVIEVKAEPPKPEPPVPPMPIYFGQIEFEKPVILLSTGGPQKAFAAGDTIGDFKILKFDRENITLGWNGKELDRLLKDLAPTTEQLARNAPKAKGTAVAAKGTATKAAKAAATPLVATAHNPNPVPPVQETPADKRGTSGAGRGAALFGPSMPGGNRACVPSDESPNGTVAEGYKKIIMVSLMGGCFWEPTK